MMNSFPRRLFMDEDLNKTLVELELVPTATIILVVGVAS